MSFTKNWYSRPTPLDMQFEERVFQTQFSVSADKLYEWNIDDLSEQEIINKMSHMSMVGIAYQNNHDLDQPEIEIVLFNNSSDKGLIIDNFERRGLYFCLLILTSYQNCLKRRMTRPNNGFICFNKI